MEHYVQLRYDSIVKVRIIECLEAQKPFIHQDRCIDYNVFLFLTSGEMKIWEDDREYIIKPGEIFFLKSGVHHWGIDEIPKGTRWFYIHFYTDNEKDASCSINDYATYVKNQEFLIKDYEHYVLLPKQLKVNYPKQLEKKLQSLCDVFRSENFLRLVQLSISVTEMFYEIYSSHKTNATADKAYIVTQRIIEYLQSRLNSKVCSSDISKQINMNYNYLSQLFKGKTGFSITEYHTRMRIFEACRLLRESELNVSEISNSLGYEDPLYFSHVFKKVMGISPTEYQKQSYSLGT